MNACKGTAGLGLAVSRYNVCILVIEGILLEQRELFTSETSYLPPGLELSLSLSDSFAVQAHSSSCCCASPFILLLQCRAQSGHPRPWCTWTQKASGNMPTKPSKTSLLMCAMVYVLFLQISIRLVRIFRQVVLRLCLHITRSMLATGQQWVAMNEILATR
jgi:hypothetical protein